MKLEDILEEYSRRHGVEPLKLNEAGVCSVKVDDTMTVTVERSLDDRGFYLYASVAKVPEERGNQIALEALKGNLFGVETGHASLGYAESEHLLIIYEYFDEDSISYIHYNEEFEQFLGYLSYWIHKVESLLGKKGSAPNLLRHAQGLLPDEGNMRIFFA